MLRKIRYGEKGDHVREVQIALVGLGFALPKFGTDGHYGAETESAGKAYAEARGMAWKPARFAGWVIARLTEETSDWKPSVDVVEPYACPGEPVSPLYGAFLWRADRLDVTATVELAQRLGLGRVMPKVMNKRGRPMFARTMKSLVPALQDVGIEVVPWAYLDDKNGRSDAGKLADIVVDLGCSGAVANMEREVVDGEDKWEKRHDANEIDDVLTVLSDRLGGYIGFSSFRRRDYFPYPQDVFRKHAHRVTFMNQCYRERGSRATVRKRVKQSCNSWLEWELPVRCTLGAIPREISKSMYSTPAGLKHGVEMLRQMAEQNALLDPGFDFWALEQIATDEGLIDAMMELTEAGER